MGNYSFTLPFGEGAFMTTSKILALSLLLISPLASACIQLRTQAEIKNSPQYGNRTMDVTFQIKPQQSLEIYNTDDVKIVAELLTAQETRCVVSFAIYAKNSAGEYEKLSNPVLVPNYTHTARISLGETFKDVDGQTIEGEIFTLSVDATKI